MTEDNKKMFEILDQLPRKLNVLSILKLYLSSHRWVDLYGMIVFYTVMVQFLTLLNLFILWQVSWLNEDLPFLID